MRTRATTRRWGNNGFGALMRSSATGMQETHFTAFAYACMLRYVAIHDPMC